MSVTYIVLNILLQNELEPTKMESDSRGEVIASVILMEIQLIMKIIRSGEKSRYSVYSFEIP